MISISLFNCRSYVYLMFDQSEKLYKIGYSDNPLEREKSVGCKVDLLDYATFKNRKEANKEEQLLHKIYKNKRIKGEWFDLDKLDLMELSSRFDKANRKHSLSVLDKLKPNKRIVININSKTISSFFGVKETIEYSIRLSNQEIEPILEKIKLNRQQVINLKRRNNGKNEFKLNGIEKKLKNQNIVIVWSGEDSAYPNFYKITKKTA